MKQLKIIISAFLLISPLAAQATYIVGGNGINVAPSSFSWSWDGTVHSDDRLALEDPDNFGPTGIVSTDDIDTVDLAAINPGTLSGLDAFVSSWWFETDSAAYDAMIRDFFLAGGDLYLFNDGSTRDGIADLLGIPTINGFTGNPNTVVSGGALDGPFGTGPINQDGQIGWLSDANILAAGGEVCATSASGRATAACWASGAYAPGAGNLVILSDVDMLSGGLYGANVPTNGESQLYMNMFAFGVNDQGAVDVPEPGTLALLGLGLAGMGMTRRKKKV